MGVDRDRGGSSDRHIHANSDIQLPRAIRKAGPGDARKLADLTAEAFRDDPFNKWLFGDYRAMRAVFRTLARHIYLPNGLCHLAGTGGASMWGTPGESDDLGPWSLVRMMTAIMFYGGLDAARRAKAAGDMMAAAHPAEPHWYLFTIGTLPNARGQGLGSALLKPVLAHCDRTGMPAYLENSNPANDGFYMSHGFRHRELLRVEEGAPPLAAMWRVPRSGEDPMARL